MNHEKEIRGRIKIPAWVVHEAIRREGEEELTRSSRTLAWSALAAGLSMGFSFVAEAVLHSALPESSWRPLVSKFGYAAGFLIVILGRQQLFTENTLTVILPFLDKPVRAVFQNLLRLWAVVLAFNLTGTLIFAGVLAHLPVFDASMHEVLHPLAEAHFEADPGTQFLRGIYAGWLIALMVWLLPYAEGARFFVIILLAWLIGICHFPHIIAGSTEVFYLASSGGITWAHGIGAYILPVLFGNITGGVALVAAINHAQVKGGGRDHAAES